MNSQKNNIQQGFTCQDHIDQKITHMCCLEDCLATLCGKCIKGHNNIHKLENVFPEIETIEDLREFCFKKVNTSILRFQKEFDKLQRVSSGEFLDQEKGIEIIISCKQKIQQLVYQFFTNIEQEYREQIQLKKKEMEQINFFSEKITKVIHNLNSYDQELQKNQSLYSLKYVLIRDFESELQQIRQDVEQFITSHIYKKVDIICNEEKLQNIYQELEKFLILRMNQPEWEYPLKEQKNLKSFQINNISKFSNTQKSSSFYQQLSLNSSQKQMKFQNKSQLNQINVNDSNSKPNKKIFQSQNNPFNKLTEDSCNKFESPKKDKNSIIEDKNFIIQLKNYYDPGCQHQYLHFFQPKSKFLHLYNLLEEENQFFKIEMNIDFKIPRWHRSISTPQGDIFLTGGVSIEEQEQKLNDCHLYDFSKNILIKAASMHTQRSGHAIAYMNNFIYAIGGFTNEKDFSTKCERYSVPTNEWIEIAPLNFKANNPCACSFNNKYIFKFGGKIDDNFLNKTIERYSPENNIWENIEYSIDDNPPNSYFKILSSSCSCQINENQILVFGGTYEDYRKKSKQTFLLEINQQQQVKGDGNTSYAIIKRINQKNLPFAEGFWSCSPVIYNKNIFCLQNISNENNSSIVYLDRRRILKFDSESWNSLN